MLISGGGSKTLTSLYFNSGGTRKSISSAYANVGGSRKQIYPTNIIYEYQWRREYFYIDYQIEEEEGTSSVDLEPPEGLSYFGDTVFYYADNYTSSVIRPRTIRIELIDYDTISIYSSFYRINSGKYLFTKHVDIPDFGSNTYYISSYYIDIEFDSTGLYKSGLTQASSTSMDQCQSDKIQSFDCSFYNIKISSNRYGDYEYVTSTNRNEYPDDGVQSDYYYTYIGQV